MEDNRAYAYLSELEDDLNEKISELDSVVSCADERVREKAILIKDRAISVLNNVKEKSADLNEVITDEVELYTAVETIRAPNEEMPFSSAGFSLTTLNISLNMRTCTPFVLIVK